MRSRTAVLLIALLGLAGTLPGASLADMGQWHDPDQEKIAGPGVSVCDMILAWPGDLVLSSAAEEDDPTARGGLFQYEVLGEITHVGMKSRHGVMLESTSPGLVTHPTWTVAGSNACPHYVAGGARASTYDDFLTATYNPYYYTSTDQRLDGTPQNHRVLHVFGTDANGNPITPQMRRRAEGYAWMQIGEWPYHKFLGHRTGGRDPDTGDNVNYDDPAYGDVWPYGGNYSLGYFNLNLPWLPQYCSSLVYWAWNLGTTATESTDLWRNGYGSDPDAARVKGNNLGWQLRPHLQFARHAAWAVDNYETSSWASHLVCEALDDQGDETPKDKDDLAAWIMGQAYGYLKWDNFYDPDVWVRGAQEIQARYNQGFETFFHDLHNTGQSTADFGNKWFYPQNQNCYTLRNCTRRGEWIRGFPPFDLINEKQQWEFGEGVYLIEDYSAQGYEQGGLWETSPQKSVGHTRDVLYERTLWNPQKPATECAKTLIANPFFHYVDQALPYGFSQLENAAGTPEIIFHDRSYQWSGGTYATQVLQIENDMELPPSDQAYWYGRYLGDDWQWFEVLLPHTANQITSVWVYYRADIEPGSAPGVCDNDYVELSLGDSMPTERICGWDHTGIAKLDVHRGATGANRAKNPEKMDVIFDSDWWIGGVGFAIEAIEVKVQDYREDLLGWDQWAASYGWDDALCHRCYNGPWAARENDGYCDPCLLYCGLGDTHPGQPGYKDPRKPQDGYDCLPPAKRNDQATIVDEMSHVAYIMVKDTWEGIDTLLHRYGNGRCDGKLLILMGDDGGDCSGANSSVTGDFTWPVWKRVTQADFDW